jgi:hypothetical protein
MADMPTRPPRVEVESLTGAGWPLSPMCVDNVHNDHYCC